MLLHIRNVMEFKESKAIYLQIADYLMNQRLHGTFREGERIISVRECAADLEVNVNTCMRAYEWLCQQQVIFTKRGLGYFVCEGAQKAILREQQEEFMNETIPGLASKMRALGISIEELVARLKDTGI